MRPLWLAGDDFVHLVELDLHDAWPRYWAALSQFEKAQIPAAKRDLVVVFQAGQQVFEVQLEFCAAQVFGFAHGAGTLFGWLVELPF